MNKFIFLTFGFLAWAFYEMSGGANFEPTRAVAAAEAAEAPSPSTGSATIKPAAAIARQTSTPEVTRAAYIAPSYDLRAPKKEELNAVDPAVLASFGGVLKDTDGIAIPKLEPAVADGGMVAGQIPTDIREVTGNSVNMRNGPGTDYSSVTRLKRGDEVQVLAEPGNGWLKLKVSDSGRIGWMADFLVSSAN